jgi:hypothetical protein
VFVLKLKFASQTKYVCKGVEELLAVNIRERFIGNDVSEEASGSIFRIQSYLKHLSFVYIKFRTFMSTEKYILFFDTGLRLTVRRYIHKT